MTTQKKQAPCNSQTAKQVEDYYRNVKPGDPAVIRCTQHYALQYTLTEITDTNPKKGRVYVKDGDAWGGAAWYAKNSKSCYHPTGQSNLVVPTPEVLKWIEEHPPGKLGSIVLAHDVDYDITPPGQRDGRRLSLMPRARDVLLRRKQHDS